MINHCAYVGTFDIMQQKQTAVGNAKLGNKVNLLLLEFQGVQRFLIIEDRPIKGNGHTYPNTALWKKTFQKN